MILLSFLAVYAIQIALTYPTFSSACNQLDIKRLAIYAAHHAFDVFLFWSPFFLTTPLEFKVHIAAAILTGIHWFSYNNRCILTVEMNRLCGFPQDNWLDSLKNRLGLKETLGSNFHFLWIGALIAYDIYMLR
jgi:hypothetical protein